MLRFFLIMIFCTSYLFGQKLASPIDPGQSDKSFVIGLTGGSIYPLGPDIIKSIPTEGLSFSQKSLLNGLNGLGLSFTPLGNLYAIFPISGDFWLGGNLSYYSWLSNNKCNCQNDTLWNSENKLSNLQVSIVANYYFLRISEGLLYVSPHVGFNMFFVNVTENNSSRESINFSKMYPRLGLGLGIGYELPLYKQLSLDIKVKGEVLNLLLNQKNDEVNFTDESKSLINSYKETTEPIISAISFNLGINYSFTK